MSGTATPQYEDVCDYCRGGALTQARCPVCKGSGRVTFVGYRAKVIDWCHGMTGGVLCQCTCGVRWSLPSSTSDSAAFRSVRAHEATHVAAPRPPSGTGGRA